MIKKCLFPVAGYGTRFLPATKSMPKEMLPIVNKPLVQYGVEEALEAGLFEIAFVTGRPTGEVADKLITEMVTVYVPTTPNPTSGFMLIVPRGEVMPLDMSVDEALKYIISMGVVAPPAAAKPQS